MALNAFLLRRSNEAVSSMNAILRSCLRLARHFLLSSVRGKLKLVIRVMKSRLESRTDWRAQSVKFLQETTSTQGVFW